MLSDPLVSQSRWSLRSVWLVGWFGVCVCVKREWVLRVHESDSECIVGERTLVCTGGEKICV